MITIPLSLLVERGVQIDAPEAVAIVQALASSRGAPTVENIEIDSDGAVRCRSSQGEPTVPALAALLNQFLPKTGIPASLRYTVARGLGAVEAPAFESVEDFSQALARFDPGDRTEIICGLLARARQPRPAPPTSPIVTSTPSIEPTAPRVVRRTAVPLPPPRLPRRSFLPLLCTVGALALSALGGYAIVDFARAQRLRSATVTEARSTTSDQPSSVPAPEAAPRSAVVLPSADHVEPSPDGQLVAFDSDRAGVRAVYVADRDGTNVRRISGEGYATLPTWSPDGTKLAFVRAEPNRPSVWNLWMRPLAGGPAERITEYPYGQTWAASWFPDGRRIAYSHETDLVIFDLFNGRMTVIASPEHGRLVRTSAVSSDGSRIAFQVVRGGAWMLNVADNSMQRVALR